METPILILSVIFFHWKFMSRLYPKKNVDFLRHFRFCSEKKRLRVGPILGIISSWILLDSSVVFLLPGVPYLQYHRKNTAKNMSQIRGFLLLTDSEIRKNDLGDIKPFIQLLVLATWATTTKPWNNDWFRSRVPYDSPLMYIKKSLKKNPGSISNSLCIHQITGVWPL